MPPLPECLGVSLWCLIIQKVAIGRAFVSRGFENLGAGRSIDFLPSLVQAYLSFLLASPCLCYADLT